MNEVNNKQNEIINNEQNTFYSTFSIAALILTITKCFLFIINIFLSDNFTIKQPLLGASLVIAIIGRQKNKDKLSFIMIVVDIILIAVEIIVYIIVFLLFAYVLYNTVKR